LSFDREYYKNVTYSHRGHLIKRHVLDVIKWGAKVSSENFLLGKGKTALDVGCAYGYGVEVLKSLGYNAYGTDISKYGIRIAKSFHPSEFLVSDVEGGLPFKENFFDLLICIDVIEHLKRPFQALKNMFACCRNTMLLTTPNRLVEKPIKKMLSDYDETHISVMTQNEWEKHIEALRPTFFRIEQFFDASLAVKGRLLLFKSFKMPCFGLNLRILIKK